MSAVNNLLDKYRKARNLSSDNACAVSLGLHRASISEWRRGKSWPSEEHIVQLASACGEDAGLWLVSVHAERSEPGAVQREWLRLASRFASAASFALVMLGLGIALCAHNPGTLYIMSTCVVGLAALGMFLALHAAQLRKDAADELSVVF